MGGRFARESHLLGDVHTVSKSLFLIMWNHVEVGPSRKMEQYWGELRKDWALQSLSGSVLPVAGAGGLCALVNAF